MKRTTYNTLN